MYKVSEEDLNTVILDLYALHDLMEFIVHKTSDDQIDKDVLQIFANSLNVSISILRKYAD